MQKQLPIDDPILSLVAKDRADQDKANAELEAQYRREAEEKKQADAEFTRIAAEHGFTRDQLPTDCLWCYDVWMMFTLTCVPEGLHCVDCGRTILWRDVREAKALAERLASIEFRPPLRQSDMGSRLCEKVREANARDE